MDHTNTKTTRDIILQAGFSAFLAHGYDGTGMTLLLSGTGLSKGAFYHHFDGKFALYEEVIRRYFPSPFAETDWAAHATLNVSAQQAIITRFYQHHVETSAAMDSDINRYFALFFDSLSRLEGFRRDVADTYSKLITCLCDALMRENALTPDAANSQARAFIAGFEGQLYLWAVTGAQPGS